MWAILAIAILALMRKRLRLRTWRKTHFALAAIIVISSVVHAILIQGTMGLISKILLCVFVVAAAIKVLGGYVKK